MSLSFDPTTLHTELFIDGAWQKAASGATFPVENPATKEIIAHVADGGPEDAALAIRQPAVRRQRGANPHPANGQTFCDAPLNWSLPTPTGSPQS